MKNIRRGMTVMVYEDPITCTIKEGKAKLIENIRPDRGEGDGLSVWEVEFLDEPGQTFCRTINAHEC